MFTVSRQIDFCYGHRLLNYAGKCRHLHGHNGRLIITLEAEQLDEQGMVLDFSEIKRVVGGWIDENLDHRMVLNRTDPAVAALRAMNEPLYLMDVNPTAENIARLIFEVARERGFPVVYVRLWETPGCCARYTSWRTRFSRSRNATVRTTHAVGSAGLFPPLGIDSSWLGFSPRLMRVHHR
jgi:6-pyruvoyltetrahydropterin/6-carboxytetrahydropterin synthase